MNIDTECACTGLRARASAREQEEMTCPSCGCIVDKAGYGHHSAADCVFLERVEAAERKCEEMREALEEWESFREAFEGLAYHSEGMGCGIEDRGITDRYQACEYGWDEAMDRVAEQIPEIRAALATLASVQHTSCYGCVDEKDLDRYADGSWGCRKHPDCPPDVDGLPKGRPNWNAILVIPAEGTTREERFGQEIVKELRKNHAFDTDEALSVLNAAERALAHEATGCEERS
jgi:hypothetical protein